MFRFVFEFFPSFSFPLTQIKTSLAFHSMHAQVFYVCLLTTWVFFYFFWMPIFWMPCLITALIYAVCKLMHCSYFATWSFSRLRWAYNECSPGSVCLFVFGGSQIVLTPSAAYRCFLGGGWTFDLKKELLNLAYKYILSKIFFANLSSALTQAWKKNQIRRVCYKVESDVFLALVLSWEMA